MAAASLARVLFDEAHSEAWTIRPELARAMQPAHPGDSSYALAAAALAERDFEVVPNVDAPLSATHARRLRRAGDRAPVRARVGADDGQRLAAAERRGDRCDRCIRARRRWPDRAGRDRAGEVRQQPERPARALRASPRERHRPGLRAPRRRPELDPRRPARRAAVAAMATCSSRVHAACLYRATTISSSNGARVLARTHPTASHAGRPADRDDASRCRSRRGPRGLGPVRR